MSHSFRFAKKLALRLREPSISPVTGKWYRVAGRLDAPAVLAPIVVHVPWSFRDLKRKGPIAACYEPWMKTGSEWHNGPPMCWTLVDVWRHMMAWKGKPARAIVDEGCEWFVNDVTSLINRHYDAHLRGLTNWPAEWDYWNHGYLGSIEYAIMRIREHPRTLRGSYLSHTACERKATTDRPPSGRSLSVN